jgi:hypothetical protein
VVRGNAHMLIGVSLDKAAVREMLLENVDAARSPTRTL